MRALSTVLFAALLAPAASSLAFRAPAPAGAVRTPVPQATKSDSPIKIKMPSSVQHVLKKFKMPSAQDALPIVSYASLAAVTAGTAHIISPFLAVAWQPYLLVGASVGWPVALILGQVLTLGGGGVAKMMGGTETTDQRLLKLCRDAADAVGVAPPTHVYEINKREPNAFAASGLRKSQSTTVAVTKGLREVLSERELSAVLAHEMGHLRHHDVARNMHVAIAAAGFGGIYELGRSLLRSSDNKSKSKSKSKKDDEGDSSAAVGLGLMAGGIALQGVAHMLRLAASRDAELKADAAAAQAFGADALISALRKIDASARARPADLRASAQGRQFAHLMISDGPTPKAAFALGEQKRNGASWLRRLGSGLGAAWRRVQVATRTHPTIETRVAALESAVASGVVPQSIAIQSAGWW